MSNQGAPEFSGEENAQSPKTSLETPIQLEDERFPTPGASWLKTYIVRDPIERAQCGPSWSASVIAPPKDVIIVGVRSVDPRHDEAWDRLRSCSSPALLKPTEGRLIDDRRFEIFEACNGTPLSEWTVANPAPSPEVLTAWTGDLADALENLQRNGLIHSRIEPDNLFVVEDRTPPRLVVGGLESVVSYARTEAIPIATDPFYGPPEAVGRPAHPGGESLLVWDWWSVGRVIQELVLGRHILEHMLDFTMSRQSADDREFAEKLLLEQAHGETRAGGLEAMPATDKRIDLLLHGLLTASVDARWGLQDVRQWLQGETPRERYRIGRNERLFRWRGRAWTVQEAAEEMRSAEFWEEGRRHIFTDNEPDTLVSFVRSEAAMQPLAQKISESSALARAPELSSLAVVPFRELILAIALQKLAGGPLVHRGHVVDNLYLRDLAAADAFAGTNFPLIQVLTHASIVAVIEKLDPGAGRMLGDCSKLALRALDRGFRQRWLTRNGTAEVMRLWSLAFDAASVSQAERQKLKELYARSDTPEVDALFSAENNAPDEVLLLAWMLPQAQQKFGFVTHEDWALRQQAALSERGRQLAGILFWKRLRRVLRLAPLLFGNLPLVLGLWILLGLFMAFAWPGLSGIPLALLPPLVAVSLRFLFAPMLNPLLAAHAPKARPWGLRDGVARCEKELSAFSERALHEREIAHSLAALNADLAHLAPNAKPVQLPPHFARAKAIAMLAWVAFILLAVSGARHLQSTPQPLVHFSKAWDNRPPAPDAAWYPPAPKEKEDFPFAIPKHPPMVIPIGHGVASEEIVRAARRKGAYLVQDYKPHDIGAPVLVQVPTDQYSGFLLYDPTSNKIVDNKVLVLKYIPPRRVFISIDGKLVFVPNY